MASQLTITKKIDFYKINDYGKLKSANMYFSGLRKTIFRKMSYFQAEIEFTDFKFQTTVFVINDYSIDFDLRIDTSTRQ